MEIIRRKDYIEIDIPYDEIEKYKYKSLKEILSNAKGKDIKEFLKNTTINPFENIDPLSFQKRVRSEWE